MKKKKPQSQRKNIPKSLCQGNNISRKQRSNINTFRQNKENKSLINQENNIKKQNLSHKESPRTIDYRQIMNKYSHLIEQNQDKSMKNIEENKTNIYQLSSYYMKTDVNNNNDKNKGMMNALQYNNNNIATNDNFFQFCRTDYQKNEKEEPSNFKYYTLKNFYQKKKEKIYGANVNSNCKNVNEMDDYKNNNIYMSYSKNKNSKKREYFNNSNKNINPINHNNSIHSNVSLRKINKYNTSSNCHSFNDININRSIKNNNFYTESNTTNNNLSMRNNISLSHNISKIKNTSDGKIANYNYITEKIISLITLCQKYAKILSDSINCIEINNNISNYNDSFEELKYIIGQYNKLMFSEKINNFFNNNSDMKIVKNNYVSNFNLNEFEPKTLNLTEKFRSRIKNLKTEKSEINDELNLYKKKNKTLLLEKEEMDLIIKKMEKENEELRSKIKNLKNIENKYYYQNNMIDKLKCQVETLNVDIKYKENIINNLQQILEQIKIKSYNNNNNTNDSDNKKYNTNKNTNFDTNNNNNKISTLNDLGNEFIINGKNNISDFLLDINSEPIEKDIILPMNLKVNSIEESINMDEIKKIQNGNASEIIISGKEESKNNILELKKNLKAKNGNNSKSTKDKIAFNGNEETETITKEMEKIDQDILNLKTKLKRIITK